MREEYQYTRFKNRHKFPPQMFEILFFGLLVGLLIILIYGLFQKDPGFGFFSPYWKVLDLVLGAAVVFGILAVFWKRNWNNSPFI